MSPHGQFMAAGDDAWISIVCADDADWRKLCDVIGKPELADDPRFRTLSDRQDNEDELEMLIMEWTLQNDPFEATVKLQAAGIAAYPPLSNRQVLENAHLESRNFFVEKEHQAVGVRRHAGIPWRMSETPCEVTRAAPILGQDNEYVFGELLGFSSDEIADLASRGVIR
jgi:crotonobetainyl-CoA:carnitine CoA-transferase CaiB-like acyl-CoA transferase